MGQASQINGAALCQSASSTNSTYTSARQQFLVEEPVKVEPDPAEDLSSALAEKCKMIIDSLQGAVTEDSTSYGRLR
jgi:hypothetical protein